MLDAGLKRAAKELELKTTRELAYGLCGGYALSLSRSEKTYTLFVDARLGCLANENAAALKAALSETCAANGVEGFAFTKTGLRVTWPTGKGSIDNAVAFVRAAVQQLTDNGVAGVSLCSNCGAIATAEDAKLVRIGSNVHLCDNACAVRLTDAYNSRTHTAKNVGAGLFGALIASVVAVAPYAVLAYFNIYAAPAAFLVPIIISLGYRAFSGRPCVGKGVIVTLLSLVSLAATAALMLCFAVHASWVSQGYIFTRSDLFTAILGAVNSGVLVSTLGVQHLAYCGVFLLLGLAFTLPQALRKQTPYAAILPF